MEAYRRLAGLIVQAARDTGAVVTAEEHNIYDGGLGSDVAGVLMKEAGCAHGADRNQECLRGSGAYEPLLEKYKPGVRDNAHPIKRVIREKSK
jgi:transketolase